MSEASTDIKKDWWDELTPKEQVEYLHKHPASEKAESLRANPAERKIPLRKGMMWLGSDDRESLPAHIKELKLPPAWKHIQFNPNPDADLLVVAVDSKSRDQYVYSEKFISANQAMKFARIREMDKKFDSMLEQTRKDQQSPDKKIAEHAIVAELIFLTGIRPGSDDDTGADKKAFGATTLEVRHFVKTDDGVRLRFTGKKGVDLDLPLNDSDLADKISKRVVEKKEDDKLFNVSDSSLRDYVKTLDKDLKTKDIRTAVGTRAAREAMKKIPTPKNERDYKAAVHAVGKVGSKVLGNQVSVFLSAYCDPTIFQNWKISSGIGLGDNDV